VDEMKSDCVLVVGFNLNKLSLILIRLTLID
jgi:hypothetical protein